MNKKILSFSILALFMLLTISFASAINNTNTTNPIGKESPLWRIRTRAHIGEKIVNIISKFLGERMFMKPFQLLKSNDLRLATSIKTDPDCTMCGGEPCE